MTSHFYKKKARISMSLVRQGFNPSGFTSSHSGYMLWTRALCWPVSGVGPTIGVGTTSWVGPSQYPHLTDIREHCFSKVENGDPDQARRPCISWCLPWVTSLVLSHTVKCWDMKKGQCVCVCACMHPRVRASVRVCACVRGCACVRMFVCVRARVRVRVRMCVHV